MATSERSKVEDRNFEVTFETSLDAIIIQDKRPGGRRITIRPAEKPDEGIVVIPYGETVMVSTNAGPALLLRNKKDK